MLKELAFTDAFHENVRTDALVAKCDTMSDGAAKVGIIAESKQHDAISSIGQPVNRTTRSLL